MFRCASATRTTGVRAITRCHARSDIDTTPLLRGRGVSQQLCRQHGVSVSDTTADSRIVTPSVIANSRKMADDVSHEQERDQHAMTRDGER